MKHVVLIFLLAGCGERFASDGGFDRVDAEADAEIDGRELLVPGDSGSGGSDAGGAPTVMDGSSSGGVYEASGGGLGGSGGALDAGVVGSGGALNAGGGSGGAPEAGGASSSGGAPEAGSPAPGLPPCCVDADCPSEIPYCTPWGTCGPGGDPYSCNYDFHCESYCYHCIGMQGGTCNAEKSCDCV